MAFFKEVNQLEHPAPLLSTGPLPLEQLMIATFKIMAIFLLVLFSISEGNCQTQLLDSLAKDTSAAYQLQGFGPLFRDSLPKPIGWTNDFENLFTDQQEKVLDSLIQDFERKSTVEIAIVTIAAPMTTKEQFDNFVLQIHNTWGVGKKDKNNGIVIGISANYRRIRISNGYGIEKILNDAETKSIIDKDFIIYFKEGDYFEGTWQGLTTLIGKLNEKMNQSNK